jgi:hypothetical protein
MPADNGRKHLLGVANRTVGYAAAGLVSAALAQKQRRTTIVFGLGMGIAIASRRKSVDVY